jgi:hypothetical protein
LPAARLLEAKHQAKAQSLPVVEVGWFNDMAIGMRFEVPPAKTRTRNPVFSGRWEEIVEGQV